MKLDRTKISQISIQTEEAIKWGSTKIDLHKFEKMER